VSTSAKARASSRELLENILRPPLRDRVLAVVDDADDVKRLAAIGSERTETTYGALLGAMIEQGGEIGVLAAHQAQVLGIRDSVRDAIAKLDAKSTAFGDALSTRELPKNDSSGVLPTPDGAPA
jgi:hypothetical protein